MMKNDENLDLFTKDSVNKVIDFQYQKTKMVLTGLFMIYVFLYCLPFITMLFTKGEIVSISTLAHVCLGTMCLFFFIELIQLRDQGIDYFIGWNIIDFAQFWLYLAFWLF
jgi:hypothetical protein